VIIYHTDQIGLENTDNYREDNKNRNGNSYDLNGCNDDEEEQSKITVYGYAPDFGGFGGMVGINFALSYSGSGGGYIATTDDSVGCNTSGNLDFAAAAFRVYRTQYIKDTNLGTFLRDHEVNLSDPENPIYVEWYVEFPDGSIGTFEINDPMASVALNGNPVSCTPAP
jgi:hypothetical protein